MFSFESQIRYSEIGEDKTLTLHSLLNYFQDCTTFHSESVGRGLDVLEQISRVWMLASWQVCVNRYPRMGERVQINTWAYDFRGFYGSRNFTMTKENGEVLAYANSLWAYIDSTNGFPVRIPQEESQAYELGQKLDMEYAPRKIRVPESIQQRPGFSVKQHHLDTNHHVNNAQYVRLAQDYLPEGLSICQMRAEYKKQARLGDRMIPGIAVDGNVYTVTLDDTDQAPYAIVAFTVKS